MVQNRNLFGGKLTRICSDCQKICPSEATYCIHCGKHLSDKCRKCGETLPSGAVFCIECGSRVKIGQYTTEFGRYPTYLTENLPLNLSHAMKAIEVHNSIVDHVIHNSSEIFKESFYQLLSASEIGSLQIAHDSGSFISEAEKLDNLWQETLIPWHKNVPPEAYAEYIENLQRERHD